MILFSSSDAKTYSNKILNRFVEAIEGTDIPNNADPNMNTKDFGFATVHVYRNTTSATIPAQ